MRNFQNIGLALRWLRSQRGRKQREVAESATITPAMLSAYETGKHRPSLETTEKVLGALGCDVVDLTSALQRLEDPELIVLTEGVTGASHLAAPSEDERFSTLLREGLEGENVDPDEEEVLQALLPGLLSLIRFLRG